jgi:predicted thioredoxin/glutaredoxin
MSDRVLFISGRCDHCKKILVGIQQHSFLKPLFKIVNVDSQPYPNYVKTVPSILINGQIISGQTVFEYFGKLVEGKKSQEERVSEGQAKESGAV